MDIRRKPLPDVLALLPGPHLLRRLETGSERNAQRSLEENLDEALRLEYELAVLKARQHHPSHRARREVVRERVVDRRPHAPAPGSRGTKEVAAWASE